MSRNHFTLSFPLKALADAKTLAERLCVTSSYSEIESEHLRT